MKNQTVRLPDEIRELIKMNAKAQDLKEAEYLRHVIQKGLEDPNDENLEWNSLQHNLLMAFAYVVSVDTDVGVYSILTKAKKEFPILFDADQTPSNVNRMTVENYFQNNSNKMQNMFDLSDFGLLLFQAIMLPYLSSIDGSAVFEPFGLSLKTIDLFQRLKK